MMTAAAETKLESNGMGNVKNTSVDSMPISMRSAAYAESEIEMPITPPKKKTMVAGATEAKIAERNMVQRDNCYSSKLCFDVNMLGAPVKYLNGVSTSQCHDCVKPITT